MPPNKFFHYQISIKEAGAASKNEKWHLFDSFGECNLEMLLSLMSGYKLIIDVDNLFAVFISCLSVISNLSSRITLST